MNWTPPTGDLVRIKDEFLQGLARLETAGGRKTIKGPKGQDSFNLFNVKDNSGRGFRAHDKAEGSNDAYRVYNSVDEAKDDVTSLLARKYPGAVDAQTPEAFAAALKKGGYATDPHYEKKLVGAIKMTKWTPPKDEAWTPPADEAWTPPAGDTVVEGAAVTAPSSPKAEPGWFEPGSKSEAVVRGLSQGATLGFGDEIQALIRSVTGPETYTQLRDEQRAANDASRNANPGTYTAANLAGSAPAFLAGPGALAGTGTVARAAGGMGAVSGAAALGGSQGSASEQLADAALGATTGAVLGGAAQGISSVAGRAADALKGIGAKAPSLAETAASMPGAGAAKVIAANRAAASKGVQLINDNKLLRGVVGAGVGAGTAKLTGTDPTVGAVLGAFGGSRAKDLAPIVQSVAGKAVARGLGTGARIVQGATGPAARAAAASLTTQALTEMSKRKAQSVVKTGEARIAEAVEQGRPEYAAQFEQMNSPTYRAAASKVREDEDDEEDE